MTKPPLGKLEPVSLRDYWLREDSEFTPRLSQPENLKLLGDAIGKELEPQGHARELMVELHREGVLTWRIHEFGWSRRSSAAERLPYGPDTAASLMRRTSSGS